MAPHPQLYKATKQGFFMARRTVYVSFISLLLCLGAVWHLPGVAGKEFTESTEIRNKQIVFYLVALENQTTFNVNCSTFFNSSIKAYLLTQRPLSDTVNASHVNCSDVDDNQNHTTLSITTNVTQIFYIQIDQMDDKTDFLLVNATQELTRYYIPFVAGYPILETILSITAALFIVQRVYKRGKRD